MPRSASLPICLLFLAAGSARAGDDLDYAVTDPALKVVRLDSDPKESFLSVRADAEGRLFVGGREALFVYEPNPRGGYRPRQLLYRFPEHTWVNDVAVRGDDLYLMTVSALYVLPGGRVKREGLRPRRLLWGVPRGHVHQCFHALTWGPEGDLYFSMGDPDPSFGDFSRPDHWGHWTFHCGPDGREQVPYNGVGGVFRCRPDGTRLRVVATGLRNPCGLTVDRHWNLFSNDNDHESMPADYVPGRLLHVTPHAYFSWPRGWMPEKQRDRADLLETMFTGMGRAVPVGMTCYDDEFLPAKYRNNLLLARWGIRAVTRYPIEPRGASFRATEQVLLQGRDQARPVGVCVGRGGRVFVTVAYMAHNDGSPAYRSDLVMITRADDPAGAPFDAYSPTTAGAAKLWEELSSASWSRRYAAHRQLLDTEGAPAVAAERLAKVRPGDPAVPHLIWLAGAARQARETLTGLAGHTDPLIRAQAVRVLAEFFGPSVDRHVLASALADDHPPVVLAALAALFESTGELPEAAVADAARSKDTYLRQTAAFLLAEKATVEQLAKLCRSDDRDQRLGGVLAVGFRLTMPPWTKPVPEGLKLVPYRNAEEACVIQFAGAKIDLRKHGPVGNYTAADYWKAVKGGKEQQRLFDLLMDRLGDDREDEAVRLQAAYFLALLNDARSEPLAAKVRKATDEKRLAAAPIKGAGKLWVAGPFPDGDKGLTAVHPPEQGAIDLSARYDVGGKKVAWKEMTPKAHYDFREAFGPCDRSSFYAYCRLESAGRQRAQLLVGSDDGVNVWHNGREVWSNPVTRGALPFQDAVLIELQPGSNDVLVRVHNDSGECGLYLHYRALGQVAAVLPEKVSGASLAERLKGARGLDEKQVAEFLKIDWTKAVAAGDARRGRQLFGSLACAKCHAITNDAAALGGPSLAEARKRFTVAYLVESVLLPSKQVSPLFRTTHVETKKGLVLTGLVVVETADKLELLLPDATRKTIAKDEVAERRLLEKSPMPEGLVKTPEELRDLLAYLLSESPTPP